MHASSSQRRMQGCSQAAAELSRLLQPVLQDRQLSAHSMQRLFEDCASMPSSSAELATELQQAGAGFFIVQCLQHPGDGVGEQANDMLYPCRLRDG